jgi:hypothetical protein
MAPTVDRTRSLVFETQKALIEALTDPRCWGSHVREVHLIETHVSYVLLTGRYAYKIKKALDLDFLHFATIEQRRADCDRELRLNRRLAPQLYLDVVPITGTTKAPSVNGGGPAIEWAVKMREFPQAALFSELIQRGGLTPALVDRLAQVVAAFHQSAAVAGPLSRVGDPSTIWRFAADNIAALDRSVRRRADAWRLEALGRWIGREYRLQAEVMRRRRQRGFVRDLHGDLHLANVALIDGEPVVFDCLEFNDELRWGDLLSEVAFMVMDLDAHARHDLAWRFLNAYLEASGDYADLGLLRFYLVYRALVRAKVASIRAGQATGRSERRSAERDCRRRVSLAERYARPGQAAVIITHGPSGAGKTSWADETATALGAIRIRTDVERKRQHGRPVAEHAGEGVGAGLYAPEATSRLYRHLQGLTRSLVQAGYPVIVDGAFLMRWQRDLFRAVTRTLGVPFVIATFAADRDTLQRRVAARLDMARDASDADLSVLDYQLAAQEPLTGDELTRAVDGTIGGTDRVLDRLRPPHAAA